MEGQIGTNGRPSVNPAPASASDGDWVWETDRLAVFTASRSTAPDVLGYAPAEDTAAHALHAADLAMYKVMCARSPAKSLVR